MSSRDVSASRTAVIIPAYNEAATIGQQLDALNRQDHELPFIVVVADNGSSDGTAAIAAGRAGANELVDLRVVDASQQRGAAHARNVGVASVVGVDNLLFCDADDEVDEGWVTALVVELQNFGVVTGRIDSERLNHEAVSQWRPARTKGLPTHEGFLPFGPSCNLAVRRDVWDALGGMNVDYPIGHDVDFSFRAQLAGYSLGYASDALLHYRYRDSLLDVFRQAVGGGRAAAQLYAEFNADGLDARPWSSTVRDWAWLGGKAPLLATATGRGTWIRRLGEVVGRLRGSAEFRTRYL